MWNPDLFSLFLKKACARISLMPGIKSTLKQVLQPFSYSPLLPIGKEPPSSSAWSLPLFLPRFVSPQFIAWVPGVFVEGLCRSWLRDFQVMVAHQLKMTEEALLSWLSRRVSFLAKAKSSYGLAFTC